MYVPREFHDLHSGDQFCYEQGGPVYTVDDGDFIDRSNEDQHRLVMYKAEDGYHGHLANHEPVWLIVN